MDLKRRVREIVRGLVHIHAAEEPYDEAVRVIALFWVMVRAGPFGPSVQRFRTTQEKEFAALAKSFFDFLSEDSPCPQPVINDEDEALFVLAAIARACDQAIVELVPFYRVFSTNANGGGGDYIDVPHSFETLISTQFVLLRRTPAWKKDGLAIGRSNSVDVVIQEHAVFPSRLNGYTIKLVRPGDESSLTPLFGTEGEGPKRAYAGVYAGARDWPRDAEGKLLGYAGAHGIDEDARLSEIITHLKNASTAGANMVVLPELTTTASVQRRLQVELYNGTALGQPASGMIVAGTFHDIIKGAKRNRAKLILLNGYPLTHQDKMKGHVADGFSEDIAPSKEINVLITPIGPTVISICRDFLDDEDPVTDVLRRLSITNIFVPSMGCAKTARAHARRLGGGAKNQQWNVFIAQQRESADAENFVLFASKGSVKTENSLASQATFFSMADLA